MGLVVSLPLDPLTLTVNRRYRSNQSLPPGVRKAQGDIVLVARAEANRLGVSFSGGGPLRIDLEFGFRSDRGDLDNPIKRTIDALAQALEFNDARVAELHVYRFVGTVGIRATITETEHRDDCFGG